MLDDDARLALKLHFGKRAGSPLHLAVREYLDGDATKGTMGAIALKHGVRKTTLHMSIKRFRAKMARATTRAEMAESDA